MRSARHASLARPSPVTAWPLRVMVLLLAVLLPLRVWAMATMPVVISDALVEASMPCHGSADQPVVDGAATPDTLEAAHAAHAATDGAGSGHSCEHCVLCHTPLATEASPLLRGPAPATAGWIPAAAQDTGRLLADTLERPPRA